MGLTTALVGGGLLGGTLLNKSMSKGSNQIYSSPTPLPQPPSVTDATDKADKIAKVKRAQASRTIYSSPLGIQGEADVARKTLLGT